jgi:SNF2 family DNA or RNA helicase
MMNYKTVPYKHQEEGVKIMLEMPVFALFDDMGTGKSKTVIDTMCSLAHEKKLEAALIVCPNSIKQNWGRETKGQIITHAWDNLNYQVYVINAGHKLWPVDRFPRDKFHWIIVNYESVWRDRVFTWLQAFMKSFKTGMVLDESQRIKTPGINQTKGCWKLGDLTTRKYIMSGTPITKNPLDYWSQFKFLDPEITGYRTYSTFRLRYAQMVPTTIGPRTFNKVVGFKNIEELLEKVGPYYRRVEKEDCLDLPGKVFERREVELSKEQIKAYQDMKNKLMVEFEGQKVKAPIALTKMLRLLQITSGYIGMGSGNPPILLGKTFPKILEVANLLEEHCRQSVVFFREHDELALLKAELAKRGIRCAEIHGKLHTKIRDEFQHDFQHTAKYDTILCQVATGGIGIDLTRADLAVYLSNSHSLEHRLQSRDRVYRIGQGNKCTYVDILGMMNGAQTLDHGVLWSLEEKQDLADLVLKNVDDLKRFFNELHAKS